MTIEAGAAGPRVGLAVDAALNLKTGGICLIVGAVVFAIWRLLHGDTPAADAESAALSDCAYVRCAGRLGCRDWAARAGPVV
jgi:hypothetical protein